MTSIQRALSYGQSSLEKTSPSARIDAEVILAHILQKTRTYLYTHPETLINATVWQQYQDAINQRSIGHPVAHLTGSKEFWKQALRVTADTLIPRPETELLVELTLSLLGTTQEARILELGTGSGAIALAIASERPTWSIQAFDISEAALHVARSNAHLLNLNQIQWGQSNWFQSIPLQSFHAIISNPPYIAEEDPSTQQGDLRFEPRNALISGKEGLDALTEIIKTGIHYLHPQGFLLVEHGYQQCDAVTTRFQRYGYSNLLSAKDIEGHDRVTGGFLT